MGGKIQGLVVPLVLICIGTACHSPLPMPDPKLVYPSRPVADDAALSQAADLYGLDLAPASDLAGDELTAAQVRRLAADNHPEVIAAQAELEVARRAVPAAAAWPNPELEGRLLVGTEKGDLGGEAALLFALPMGGRLGATEAEASARLDLARLGLGAARLRAVLQAERLMARLAHASARLAVVRALAAKSDTNADLARSRLEAAMADPLDVALIEAAALSDARAVARAQAALDQGTLALRAALGLPPNRVDFRLPAPTLVELGEDPLALQNEVVEKHPSVQRAWLMVALADREAAKVAAERAPDLLLGPAVAGEGGALSFGVQLGLKLPLLASGAAEYERALAARTGANRLYQQARVQTLARLVSRVGRVKALEKEARELLTGRAGRLDEAVSLAESRFAAGKLDVLKLLSIVRAHMEWRLMALDAQLAVSEALIDLSEALGRRVKVVEVQG
jgi:outer membrane protein TolC